MIIFDARKIVSFEDFDDFLKNQTLFFNEEKQKLFNKYSILKPVDWDEDIEKYQLFRNEYRELIQKVIKTVISHYRSNLPQKCLIYEFGSFTKHTERILSDIDLTICYDEPKTLEYECIEELINYTIASILGYSIDHVHGKFQHYPNIPEFEKISEEQNQYKIVFNNKEIDYKCGPETFGENLMNIKNVRDYKSLITGYEEKYQKEKNIDCLYSIDILENTTNHDFLFDLSELENKNDICNNYSFNLQLSKLDYTFSISELKKILKHHGVVEFYIFISKLRKQLSFNNRYSMNMENIWENPILSKTFGNDFMKKMKKTFTTFIFYWNRIELSLHKRGIALSTRCYKRFTINEINKLLNNDWGNGTNIDSILSAKNNLTKIIQEGLSNI